LLDDALEFAHTFIGILPQPLAMCLVTGSCQFLKHNIKFLP
jgi:hypothetical protein